VDAGGDEFDPADVHHGNPGCTVDELAVEPGPEDAGGTVVSRFERIDCMDRALELRPQNQRWFDLPNVEQAEAKKSPVAPFARPSGISWIVLPSCG
jgi:hypothetical protein